ncbi:MAG: hypothetical protein P4M08_10615 [Oligoflexia bacterium]|nr:hypothetical protein [Oligoflexia bacterium]
MSCWSKNQHHPLRELAALALLLSAVAASGCTNGARMTTSSQSTSASTTGTSNTASTGTTTPLITISNVLRDQFNPNGTIDVIDTSGAIGTYCIGTVSSNPTAGPSSCECNYTYTSNGQTESISVPTTYQDTDLLKCSITTIPTTVTSVQVSVTVTTQSNTSSPFTLNFQTSGTGLDTTSASSFSQVLRYTCRDTVYIPDSLDPSSGIYDPLQSEDPKISYPLDFYATNLGAAINAYAGGASGVAPPTYWNCPSNPLSPPSPFHVTLYSQTALNGSKVISGLNSDGSVAAMNAFNPRSTFYLANSATGIFSVPINTYYAPTLHSYNASAGTGLPPIGYGASPISGSSPGTESCPNVPIPAGYAWVKVWLFRAALPTRVYLKSTAFSNLGNIDCNPGPYPKLSTTDQYSNASDNTDLPFNDCFNLNGYASVTAALTAGAPITNGLTTPTATLVSRFFEQTGMCVNPTAGGSSSSSGNLDAPYSSLTPTPPVGADIWTPIKATLSGGNTGYPTAGVGVYSCTDPSTNAAGVNLNDPVNLCKSTSDDLPNDTSPTTQTIDDPASPRFDFLFVVTPQTVMSGDMSNASSPVYQQYAPYRFRSDSDCSALDPDAAGCNLSDAFTMYGIKFYDVGSAGDAPSSSGTATQSFPVCALQPAS